MQMFEKIWVLNYFFSSSLKTFSSSFKMENKYNNFVYVTKLSCIFQVVSLYSSSLQWWYQFYDQTWNCIYITQRAQKMKKIVPKIMSLQNFLKFSFMHWKFLKKVVLLPYLNCTFFGALIVTVEFCPFPSSIIVIVKKLPLPKSLSLLW